MWWITIIFVIEEKRKIYDSNKLIVEEKIV